MLIVIRNEREQDWIFQVQQLKCLAGKCDSAASPQQVRDALRDDGLYERYEALLLNLGLQLMDDVMLCPRPSCQQPVLLDTPKAKANATAAPALRVSEVATCAVCAFTFCTYCKKAYHGIAKCDLNSRTPRATGPLAPILTSYVHLSIISPSMSFF